MWLTIAAWVASVGVTWGNYDEYMTCGSGNDRYGRQYHHFPELPCDISRNSWCESAGTQYPWREVRKFVYENQGLMKRMYGNQRHYNVLRSELLNEMYEEMFDEMPKRQHQYLRQPAASARSARYQKPSSANTLRTNSGKPGSQQRTKQRSPHNSGSKQRTTHNSGSKQRTDSRAMKVSIVPDYSGSGRHHGRTRPKIQSQAPKIRVKTPIRHQTSPDTTSTTTAQQTARTTNEAAITTTSEGPVATTTEDFPTTEGYWYDTDEDTEETQIRDYTPLVEADTVPPLVPIHTYEDSDDDEWTTLSDLTYSSSSPYSTSYTTYDDTESSYVSMTIPETSTSALPTSRTDILDELLDDEGYISTPLDEDDLTTLTLTADDYDQEAGEELNIEVEDESGVDGAGIWDVDVGGVMEDDYHIETVTESERLQVENREQIGDGILVETQPENREQVDHVRVDDLRVEGNVREEAKTEAPTEAPMHINRPGPVRGINACPVKEEFVAPYWANNTRGQTLALLNLYPFEQYVQWERCQYEHRQMYCRAGCRCEQQYRLHKLLAFDPSNECRGIFSDWFRFPSCCVCKCYDLPMEVFTASSRRPRFNTDDEEDDYEYVDENGDENGDGNNNENYPAPPRRPTYVNIPPQRRPRLPPRPYSHISPPSYKLKPPTPSPSSLDQPGDNSDDQTFSNPHEENSQTHFSQNHSGTNHQNQKFSATQSHRSTRLQKSSRAQMFRGLGMVNSEHKSSTQRPEVSTLGTVDVATHHYYYNLTNYARVQLAKGPASSLTRIPRSPEE